MYAEINREVFNKLVSINEKAVKTKERGHVCRTYWIVHGITLIKIRNYISGDNQYYIQDINA